MLIKQIPVRNALRNYMYILACEKTKEALAIDPLDHALCLKTATDLGWTIKTVANTHHHYDHIDGNGPVIKSTGAELVSHSDAMEAIPNVDRGLNAGDTLQCGEINFKIMDTPGHTMSHICLYFSGDEKNEPALFCGDTLFNAGVGRCDFGGDPEIMFETFSDQIFSLEDNVRIYPGHDYIENNLKFTLDREPSNNMASSLLEQFNSGLDSETFVSDIGLEREINVFFRINQKDIRQGIAKSLNVDVEKLDAKKTFVALRGLRDNW